MVCLAVVEFDFGSGALIFFVSLFAAPCSRRYCFTAPVHGMHIFDTFLTVLWSFIRFVHFSVFFCFPGISMNLGGSFSSKVSRRGVEVMFLVFIQAAFCIS